MEEKLLNCLTFFELKDLIGFASYMKVDSELIKKVMLNGAQKEKSDVEKDWENLICEAVYNFSQKNRFEKRRILGMVKEIKKDNLKIKKELSENGE